MKNINKMIIAVSATLFGTVAMAQCDVANLSAWSNSNYGTWTTVF